MVIYSYAKILLHADGNGRIPLKQSVNSVLCACVCVCVCVCVCELVCVCVYPFTQAITYFVDMFMQIDPFQAYIRM